MRTQQRLAACAAFVVVAIASPRLASATVTASPSTVDLGSIDIGSSGNGTTQLSSTANEHVDLAITGCSGGSGNFSLSQTANIVLNNPVTITVTYNADGGGTRTCTVTVTDSMSMTQLTTFTIRAFGANPPTISLSGTTTFASVRWNDMAPTHTSSQVFTVTNNGDSNLTVSSVSTTGDFAVTGAPGNPTIGPGSAKNWTITFDPSGAGTRNGSVTFNSNDPNNAAVMRSLSGVGTNGVIAVTDLNQLTPPDGFGIVAVGSTSSLDVLVTNTGAATKGTLSVFSATINNGAGWFSFNGCGFGTACNFGTLPILNGTAFIGIRCIPPSSAATGQVQTGTVSFTSDTDSTADTTASLRCEAGRIQISTNPSMVMFPDQLVLASQPLPPPPPPTITVMVTNDGNVAFPFWFRKNGAGASQFGASHGTGCGTSSGNQCTVAAKVGGTPGTLTFDVSFTATTEGDVSAGLDLCPGASCTAPYPQLSLVGRGIDHHISVPMQVVAPDTYRSPGDMAPAVAVTVKNIGEHKLEVTDLALAGGPVWSFPAGAPQAFTVPPLGSYDVTVNFSPLVVGKAAQGQLTVTSDDRNQMISIIQLDGNGADRDIDLGPSRIEFPVTGAGVPTRYSETNPMQLLTVTNHEMNEFQIQGFDVEPPDAFTVVNMDGSPVDDELLPAGETRTFDVLFSPNEVMDYQANLVLVIRNEDVAKMDSDGVRQKSIQVLGQALFVNAHGSGGFGCSTTGGGSSGLVVVVATLLVRRRRRR